MRKQNRIFFLKKYALLPVCLAAALLAGCGSRVQTEEQIVVSKETKEKAQQQESEGEITGGIQEQVQAPERLQDSFGDDKVSVKVDAPVFVPEAEGFKTKKVKSRVFVQEDYDLVSKVLFGGGALWNRDETGDSNGFTRAEIEERIELLEKERASGTEGSEMYGGKEINCTEQIANWKKMLEAAPEEILKKEVPAVVPYKENGNENYLIGNVTAENQDYFVSLDNNLNSDWRWIRFEVSRAESGGNFMEVQDAELDGSNLPGMKEEIQKKAEELASQLGFEDFISAGGEYFANFSSDERLGGALKQENVGYGIHFTRTLDGIPVTFTKQAGTSIEQDIPSWPYESLTIIYDEKGLVSFLWEDPYEIENLSEDYVFLLPFSDIWQTAGEMLLKKYGDKYDKLDWKQELEIDEVRLGYMRIREKGNPTEGTMVPVWDFFGSRTMGTLEKENNYTEEGPFESWLTINAMDGTVVDRDFGY